MTLEHELRCDDGSFADWTATTAQAPSVIEQVVAGAHDGARGNHIVVNQNDKLAYASLQNWASAMSLGELRAIGFWWKVVVLPPPAFGTGVLATSIDADWAVILGVKGDNSVRLTVYHDGGVNFTQYVPLFGGTEWRHVRLALIRHATAGGAQLYDGNNLLIDAAQYTTTNRYNGTPDGLHAGAVVSTFAGFDTRQDEFRIATTLAEAGVRTVIHAPPSSVFRRAPRRRLQRASI